MASGRGDQRRAVAIDPVEAAEALEQRAGATGCAPGGAPGLLAVDHQSDPGDGSRLRPPSSVIRSAKASAILDAPMRHIRMRGLGINDRHITSARSWTSWRKTLTIFKSSAATRSARNARDTRQD
uniref:Uncharacterized protein n=1 Tax=Cereibacter sphaeroides (strain ATCC 17025 / ATH 2.4.3) TaxID=349102 RepID=A4X0A2_CERS5